MSKINKVVKSAGSGRQKPPAAGMGRKKGVPNKITKQLKDMILGALDQAGGQNYLAAQAKKNPGAFLTLIGKVLPMQVTGLNGEPVQVDWILQPVEAKPAPKVK